jgi:hypothetical protein
MRSAIKDDALAAELGAIELDARLSATESRQRARVAIEKRYTVPARDPDPLSS